MSHLSVKQKIDLQNQNTFAVPSVASNYMEIHEISDLKFARNFALKHKLKILALGEGSNVLLPSEVKVLVLRMMLRGIREVSATEGNYLIEAAAGENWHNLVKWTVDQQLYGLENLALIPGTVGAAPVQNIGAYGVELSDYLDSLEYFDLVDGKLVRLTVEQCQFTYRNSIFKEELLDRAIITRIWIHLKKDISSLNTQASYPVLKQYLMQKKLEPIPENIFKAVCAIRQSRLPDPQQVPNLGSFFHNPIVEKTQYQSLLEQFPDMPGYAIDPKHIKIPAAWLIESVGLKGQEVNGLKVSDIHALVLTNPNRLDADAVMMSASVIQQKVKDAFGVQLNIEPRVYSNL